MRRDRKGCGDLLCVAEKQMKKAWQFQAASGSQRMESHYFFCATAAAAAATGRMLRSLSVAASAVNLFAKKKEKIPQSSDKETALESTRLWEWEHH